MTKELKPCPFCGGEAQINERYRSGTANRKMYWVSCKACGISQQNTNVSGYRYQSKAIDRWNRREPMDKIVEQLKQLSIGTVLCDKCEYREKCDDIQEKYNPDDDTDLCTMVAKSLAIEIVKGGVV